MVVVRINIKHIWKYGQLHHHDNTFFVGFREAHYKIHGKVSLDSGRGW